MLEVNKQKTIKMFCYMLPFYLEPSKRCLPKYVCGNIMVTCAAEKLHQGCKVRNEEQYKLSSNVNTFLGPLEQ